VAPAEAQRTEPPLVSDAERVRCRNVARRVDAIVASWSLYHPDDPVLLLIKNAIDATDGQMRQQGAHEGEHPRHAGHEDEDDEEARLNKRLRT